MTPLRLQDVLIPFFDLTQTLSHPPLIYRMAGICLKLRPLVGISRSELAEVGAPPAGSSLRRAAEGAAPTAPSHHGIPQRHSDRGEAALCSQQPGRAFQTFRGQTPLL